MAPKSLPHSITPPGLSALFPGRKPALVEQATPSAAPPPAASPAPELAKLEPVPPVGEGSATVAAPAPAPVTFEQKLEVVAPPVAPAVAPTTMPVRSASVRKMSKGVRVTQPEVEGKPKGRHTLVFDETVLEELSLLAWAENMSVSALAREAFDAYLASRRKAVNQARELRESFGRKREAV